jgi:hypothetical protein
MNTQLKRKKKHNLGTSLLSDILSSMARSGEWKSSSSYRRHVLLVSPYSSVLRVHATAAF